MSETNKRSGCKSCLIWFCVVFAVFAVMIGAGLYMAYRKFTSFRDQYTQTKPLEMPVTIYSKDELDAVNKRIEGFLAVSRSDKTNAQLSLSAADINAWLSNAGFSNKVYVSFTNSSLVGQISMPMDSFSGFLNRFGISFLDGRYLNGAGVFDVGWVNGELSVKVKDILVNGQPLPEHYMSGIRNVNYAERQKGTPTGQARQDPLENISRVAIENGALIFETGGTNQMK